MQLLHLPHNIYLPTVTHLHIENYRDKIPGGGYGSFSSIIVLLDIRRRPTALIKMVNKNMYENVLIYAVAMQFLGNGLNNVVILLS